MPNFQMGLMYAMSRFAISMTDVLGRTRGSSQADPDLDRAVGLLKYDGTIWIWEPRTSLMPTASAERQYVAGEKALMAFNRRLADGQAVFDRRADNLITFLWQIERISATSRRRWTPAPPSRTRWFDFRPTTSFTPPSGGSMAITCCCSSWASISRASSRNATSRGLGAN